MVSDPVKVSEFCRDAPLARHMPPESLPQEVAQVIALQRPRQSNEAGSRRCAPAKRKWRLPSTILAIRFLQRCEGPCSTPRNSIPVSTEPFSFFTAVRLDRRFWDGFKIPGALRFAAELAYHSDTAVFTVDRLGYAESPYDRGPGSGFKLTPDTSVETTHETIAQIRGGSYEVLGGPTPPQGAAGVVLGGQSMGAAVSTLYATRYQDIDGLAPFGWSSQMLVLPGASSSMFVKILNEVVTPQLNAGADYLYFFPPEETNYSNYCQQAGTTCQAWIRTFSRRLAPTAFTIGYPLGSSSGCGRWQKRLPRTSAKLGLFLCSSCSQGRTIWCPVRSGVAWRKRRRRHDPRDRALASEQQVQVLSLCRRADLA